MDKSDIKTVLLAAIAAAAFIAAAFVSVAPAAAQPVYRDGYGLHRVTAVGISETRGPGSYNEWRARRLAIEHWRQEVIHRYGFEYAHWFSARKPEVTCDGRYGRVRCEASAIPAPRGIAGRSRWSMVRT